MFDARHIAEISAHVTLLPHAINFTHPTPSLYDLALAALWTYS